MEKGYKKPCFEMYHPDYGFHSHVMECAEFIKDPASCHYLATRGKWKTCNLGRLSKYYDEYREWQGGKGNRCPHCGIDIDR